MVGAGLAEAVLPDLPNSTLIVSPGFNGPILLLFTFAVASANRSALVFPPVPEMLFPGRLVGPVWGLGSSASFFGGVAAGPGAVLRINLAFLRSKS